MNTFFKIVAITSPVLALVVWLTVVQLRKTEIRYDLANRQFEQQTQQFDRDFAHFFDKNWWQKKRWTEIEKAKKAAEQERKKKIGELKQLEQKEQGAIVGLENGMKSAGKDKSTGNRSQGKLQVPDSPVDKKK